MTAFETVKRVAESVTGWRTPSTTDLTDLVSARTPNAYRFTDDGFVPNHPHWPMLVYPNAVALPDQFDPATVMEALFAKNGWGESWRNGIYPYVHYHSQIQEVLGVARGWAKVQFGGKRGLTLEVKAGDVAILPAGTGHEKIEASDDLLVVGAYPPEGRYDLCRSGADHDTAVKAIAGVPRPSTDPVYGEAGALLTEWTSRR